LQQVCALFVSFIVVGAVFAGECTEGSQDCARVGQLDISIGFGIGGRSNPVANNDDLPILIVPTISYYGKHFFVETDTLGLTLVDRPRAMFNVIATISYDQIYFKDWGVGNFSIDGGGAANSGSVASNDQEREGSPLPGPGSTLPIDLGDGFGGPLSTADPNAIDLDRLHARDLAALMGFEYHHYFGEYSIAAQALRDVSSVHDGYQFRLALSHQFARERHRYSFSIGADWKDSDTLDYYFGVREDEVDNPLDAYFVDSGVSFYVKTSWQYQLSKRWGLTGTFHHRMLSDDVRKSPIVDQNTSTAVFLGGVYHF